MILHVDGDSFFASCEVALNPALRGKPVVTGLEKGIASAMTYEAKARGVHRGMRIFEIRKVCPEAIILNSNYDTYEIFSRRMFNIVRRYALKVEEYSIDECFADLTGLPAVLNCSYQEIARRIKHDLTAELGMTFSIGVASTKVLAKVASKWKKPDGLTFLYADQIEQFLKELPIDKVWGIGKQTSIYLHRKEIRTALDFTQKNQDWVRENLAKPYEETWLELRGVSVRAVHAGQTDKHQSIQKTRTFKPPSNDREFVFSQLSKNIENACIKARRHGLVSAEIYFFLKTQEFHYQGMELRLPFPTNAPQDLVGALRPYFEGLYKDHVLYRATGITLRKLMPASRVQADLFGRSAVPVPISKMYEHVDALSRKYGKHVLYLGSSMKAMLASKDKDQEVKHLAIPLMGEVF